MHDFREQVIAVTMKRRGCGREEAEIILDRIADRLDGYTHEEVVAMHPLPAAPLPAEKETRPC